MQQFRTIGLIMLLLLAAAFYWKALNQDSTISKIGKPITEIQQKKELRTIEKSKKWNQSIDEYLHAIRFDDQSQPMRRYFRKDPQTNGYHVYTLYYTNKNQDRISKFVSMKINKDGTVLSFNEYEF